MKTFNNLPLYEMDVDADPANDEGVNFVALVDKPAIKKSFLTFRASAPMAFAITSEDRHIISGPLMLADTPIYRVPPEVPEPCYITFPAPAIEAAVRKFFTSSSHQNVNLMHSEDRQVQGLTMFESFIVDSSRGIAAMKGYEDAPEGSWFGSFIVNNDEVWQQVKEGLFTGFSVEGIFARLIPQPTAEEALMSAIGAILENIE